MTVELDTAMKTFMEYYNVRNAQLAFGRNGKVEVQRAYDFTEPESSRDTQVYHCFLLASVSKAFCNAAIYHLYPDPNVRETTKVFADILGYNPKDGKMGDPRLLNITIKHLLEHKGGFNDQYNYEPDTKWGFYTRSPDPTYNCREVGQALGHPVREARDLVDYIWTKKLDYEPGAWEAYSNIGYAILSEIVRVKSQQSYMDFLQRSIIKPLGLRVVGYATHAVPHLADQSLMLAESYLVGPAAYNIEDEEIVNDVYGGDGMVKEACLGPASLMCNAADLVKFVGTHGIVPQLRESDIC